MQSHGIKHHVHTLRKDDRGASAILIAFSMVVLLGFAAITIDAAGFGFNERRQAQSASDVGALAAVQFAQPISGKHAECAGLGGINLSRCNGAMEAIAVANATIDDPTLVDWSDGSLCTTPPAGYTVSSVSNCIAFNSNNQRAWVRIPTIQRPTTIARAIGFNSIAVSADAIAGTEFGGGGKVLPFMQLAGAGNYGCLKAFANPNFGPCDDLPENGNFGWADFYRYGNVTEGLQTQCTTGPLASRFVANIAIGVDHPLGRHPTGSGAFIHEQGACPDFNAEPNALDTSTGNKNNILEPGLLYGASHYTGTPYPGRIQDSGGYLVRNSQGAATPAARINNTPLWNYLASSSVAACAPGSIDTPEEMDACIAAAKSSGTVIFNDSIGDAMRFGWVPQVYASAFGPGGSGTYYILDFLPVYLDTTWYGCSAIDCEIIHTPGIGDLGNCSDLDFTEEDAETRVTCGTPGSGTNTLQAMTAYVLSQDLLPESVKIQMPGSANQREFRLID